MLIRRYPAVLALVALLIPSLTSAQYGGEGVLNAVSYQAVPASEALEVRALDNSQANLALVERMKQALRLRGRGARDGSKLVMTLDPQGEIGAWSTTDRRHVLEVTGNTGPATDDETEVRVNLFDSASGGVLNKGAPGTKIVTPSQYVLKVRIEDRANGRQLWEGWATANLDQGSSQRILESMIPALADAIGQTITRQKFFLP